MKIPVTNYEIYMLLGNFMKIFHVLSFICYGEQILNADFGADNIMIFLSHFPLEEIKTVFSFRKKMLGCIGIIVLYAIEKKEKDKQKEAGAYTGNVPERFHLFLPP